MVLGSNGQLGQVIVEKLLLKNYQVHAFDKSQLDITDSKLLNIALKDIRPEFLVNCAAWTNVVDAEMYKDLALKINGESLKNLSKNCASQNIKLVHFSTDHVFSGKENFPYKVDSEKNPVNYYGYTKSIGEDYILNCVDLQYWILRTSWLYGNSNNDFINKILNQYKLGQFPIRVVSDQFGHPTYVYDLAERFILMVELGTKTGVYHASNSGLTSWYEFAVKFSELLGLDTNKFVPASTKDFDSKVSRPMCVSLDFTNWAEVELSQLRSWDDALINYINGRSLNDKNNFVRN